jgi:hypothetical protein
MFGNLLALLASRRSGLLLTGLVVAMVVAGGGNAAELRLPISFASLPKAEFDRFLANRPIPETEEARRRLFEEFLSWRKAHPAR